MPVEKGDFLELDTSREGPLSVEGFARDYPGLALLNKLGFCITPSPDGRNLLSIDGSFFAALHAQEDLWLATHAQVSVRDDAWRARAGHYVRGRKETHRPSLSYDVMEAEGLLGQFLTQELQKIPTLPEKPFPVFLIPEGNELAITMKRSLVDTPYPQSLCRLMLGMLGIVAKDGRIAIHRSALERPLGESLTRLEEGRPLVDEAALIEVAGRDGAFAARYHDESTKPTSHVR